MARRRRPRARGDAPRPSASSSTRARCARRPRASSCTSRCRTQMLEKIVEIGADHGARRSARSRRRALGAIVDEAQLNTVLGYIESGRKEGARVASRRQARAAGERRLLRRADGVRRRDAGHEDRARGNLRAGALDAHLQGRRGGGRDRERRELWPHGRGLDAATSRRRTASRKRAARRHGVRELLRRRRHHRALRRLQAVGQRPRQVAARDSTSTPSSRPPGSTCHEE